MKNKIALLLFVITALCIVNIEAMHSDSEDDNNADAFVAPLNGNDFALLNADIVFLDDNYLNIIAALHAPITDEQINALQSRDPHP